MNEPVRDAFEKWKEDYALVYEPNYCSGTDADCLAAFKDAWQSRQPEIDTLIADRNTWADQADERVKDWDEMRRRAEKAEEERDALRTEAESWKDMYHAERKRIEEAPIGQVLDCDLTRMRPTWSIMDDRESVPLNIGGQRVRLVVDEEIIMQDAPPADDPASIHREAWYAGMAEGLEPDGD